MVIFYLFSTYLTIIAKVVKSDSEVSSVASNKNDQYSPPLENCIPIDGLCLDPRDVPNYEAIRNLHAHLDDDHSGDIDLSESVEFLRDELNYTKGLERRQEAFHPNNDQHISVQELWHMWIRSEVYNWTVETTVSWLCKSVELGQYADVFYENAINGSLLPRLATNNEQFLSRILGIKSATHRSKIAIKAMDVVLFGPPKDTGSYVKDVTIACLFILLLAGITRFYHVKQNFEKQRSHMMREMSLLHEEEERFQLELQKLKEAPQTKLRKTEDDKGENASFGDDYSVHQDSEWDSSFSNQILEDEPLDLDVSSRNLLQLWLQLTYERERLAFEEKCRKMEQQLENAKEMCEKLNSTKKQLFGALVVVHGKIESKYQAITQARESFNEITMMHKEKEQRWTNIEAILGFDIIENPGLTHLEFLLEPDLHQLSTQSTAGISPGVAESGRMSASSSIYNGKGSSLDLKKKKGRIASPLSLSDNAHDLISIKSSVSSRGQNSSKLKQAFKLNRNLTDDDLPLDKDSPTDRSENGDRKSSHLPPLNLNRNTESVTSNDSSCKFLVGNSEIQVTDGGSALTPDSSITVSSLPPLGTANSKNSQEEASSQTGSEKKAGKSASEPSLETMAATGGVSPPASANGQKNSLVQMKVSKRSNLLLYHSAKAKFSKFRSRIEKGKQKDKG